MTTTKTIMAFLTTSMIAMGVSCVNKPSVPTSQPKEAQSVEMATRHLPFSGDFSQITNMGSINIEYTTGPCDIVIKGPKNLTQLVSAEIDCGILLLSLSSERNQDIHQYQTSRTDLTAYISSPSLSMLAICGSGGFTSHNLISTDDMHIGALSNGPIIIDSLMCKSLRYEINGTSRDSIGHLRCDEAIIVSSASGRITLPDVNVSGELALDDNSGSQIVCKGKTTSLVINNQGRGLISFEGTYSTKSISQGKNAQVILR